MGIQMKSKGRRQQNSKNNSQTFKTLLFHGHWAKCLQNVTQKHSWGIKIQVCSNEGHTLLQGKILEQIQRVYKLPTFKNLLPQNHMAILTENGTKHPQIIWIQVYSNEGPRHLSRGMIIFFFWSQFLYLCIGLEYIVYLYDIQTT